MKTRFSKLLSLLLSLAMVLSMMPATVLATETTDSATTDVVEQTDGEFVAKIGDTNYTTLADAVTAANAGDTVTLQADVDKLPIIDKAITIDGNGKSVAGTAGENQFGAINGTVTLKNINFTSGDWAHRTDYQNVDYSDMIVVYDGCTFNNLTTYAILAGSTGNDTILGGLEVKNCTFNAGTAELNNYMLYAQCVKNLTVTGCTFNGGGTTKGAIHTGDSTKQATVATISDNTIKGVQRGVVIPNRADGSTLAVSGNKFNAVTTGAVYIHEIATAGAAVSVTNNTATDTAAVVYSDKNNTAIAAIVTDATGNTSNGETVTITFGTDGTVTESTGSGSEDVIDTADELKAAIAAAQSGDTVTIGGDIEIAGMTSINVPAGVTIDGGNHTITFEEIYYGSANATLYGSSGSYTVKNVTVKLTTNNTNGFAFDMAKGGTLENVTVDANYAGGVFAGSNTTIKNCTFNTATSGSYYGVSTDGAPDNVVVEDCTFNGNRAAMLYGTNVTFTGNTVTGEKGLSIAAASGTVSGNTFTGARAMSVTAVGATITGNNISANSLVEYTVTADLSGNYWGGSAPTETQLVSEVDGVTATVNSYYTTVSEDGSLGGVVNVGGSTEPEAPVVVEVDTYDELKAALANGGNIKLTADITTTAALTTSGVTATIDLNGKTLNVRAGDNKFNDATNLTIKNGTINIDDVVVSGNAIFCLDEYEKTLVTTVTLDNVDVTGKDYSSAYGVFYIGASSVLNVNGGEWTLTNDLYDAGGVFKADDAKATLSISGTEMTLHNVRRVVTYANTTIANSTIAITGDADGVDVEMEHGFNRSPLTITNSTITMENLVGRGITAECGAVSISDNSTVTITNAQEATIEVRANQTVTVDSTSTVTVDADPTITSGTISGVTVDKVYPATIGETDYDTVDAAFDAAVDGDVVKINEAGTYALSTSGKNITITGTVDGVVFDNIGAKNMGGANVTFNNVTFDYYPNVNYTGLQHSGNLVYNNCTINGQVFLYGASETFNNCTFNQNSADAYNVWTYGAKEVKFNECTFNSAGKSVLIYSEQSDLVNDVTVTDCDFTASAPVEGKAAIEMDSSLTSGIKLTIDTATTATGFASGNVSGNSLWNNKKGSEGVNNDITVTVDDEIVLKPIVPPTGTITPGYTSTEGKIWGEASGNADETFVIKVYSDETLMGTTQLNNVGGIIDGDVYVTWSIKLDAEANTDEYWTMEWDVEPNVNTMPDKVELWVDGVKVAENEVQLNAPDNVNKIVAAVSDSTGKILRYATTLQAAVDAAEEGETITLLRDVTLTKVLTVGADTTLDLNGHTVNLPQLKIDSNITVEVKNGSLVGTSADYDTIRSEVGTLTLTNVNVSGLRHTVRIKSGTATINGGTYTYGGTTTVYNTLHIINVGDDEDPENTKANVTIKAGTFIAGKPYTYDGGCAVKVQKGSTVTIEGGTFSNGVLTTLNADNGATLSVTGGTYDQDPTAYVAEGYAALPNLNDQYVVGEKPTATVKDLGAMTIPSGDYYIYNGSLTTGTEDMPLNFVMQFVADQDAEDMLTSPFSDWYADFVITFEGIEGGSFDPAGCYLAGYYGSTESWDGMWVKIPIDGLLKSIDAGTRYPVMMGVGMAQTYDYICSGVQAFSCAMYIPEEILVANPNLKVNLELNVVDSSDNTKALEALQTGKNIYNASETSYTAEDFKAGVATVTDAEGNVTKYETLAEALTDVGAGDVVIELLADATLDYNAREAYGTAGTTSLTIKGNGHTLTLNQKNSDWSSVGLANTGAKLVMNNMTIEKTGYGDTSGAWNTHTINFTCNVEMTDVTVNNSMSVENGATLNNVTINEANGYYGLWIKGNGQTVTVNGGAINATNGGRGIKIADEYVDSAKQVTLNVTGTKFNTAKKAAVLVSSTAGAKVTATDCDITNVAADSTNMVWVDEDWAAYYNSVKVYGGATKTQENEESFPIKVWYVNDNGEATSVRAYYKTLDELFAAPATQVPGSNYIELRGNVVAENKVDVNYGSNRVYTFGTSVEGGVTMDFKYADNWNMLPKFDLGENITVNVPYLQVIGGDIEIAGTLNTTYLYLYGTGEGVTITETGVVNANTGDATVQVKGGTVLTVNGKLNTSILNVWTQDVNNSELIVSGEKAKVNATKKIDAWNPSNYSAAQKIVVKDGATVTTPQMNVNRGATITVDAATLTADTLTLGYEGNIGTLTVLNNGVITNGVVLSSADSTVTGPENMNVTTTVADSKVVYEDGVYSVVAINYVAQVGDVKYETLAEAATAAKSGDIVTLLADVTLAEAVLLPAGITLNSNGKTINGTIKALGNLTFQGNANIKILSGVNGGTITVEDGKTLTLNNFSFGSSDNADAEYTITGGTITANYGFFQYGKYALYSNFETGYMYYSYGSDITVYGTFHSQGKGDGLDYVRGKLTIADGGKSIHDKALWVGQPESGGAMNASLIVESGATVQANSLSVYSGSEMTVKVGGQVTASELANTGTITVDAAGYTGDEVKVIELSQSTVLTNVTLTNGDGYELKLDADGDVSVVKKAENLIEFAGTTATFGNSLALNFYVYQRDFDGDGYYMTITRSYADERENTVTRYDFSDWKTNGIYYFVTYDEIAAYEMTDELNVQVFDGDGNAISAIRTDSVRNYAMRMIESQSDDWKTAFVDMLNYGAAAQEYFDDYHVDDLANSQLNDSQKEYATDNAVPENTRVNAGQYVGTTLTFHDTIIMTLYFKNVTEGMYATVSYQGYYGESYSETIQYADMHVNGSYRGARIDSLIVADGCSDVTCTLYNADGSVAGSVTDSMESYLARFIDDGAIFGETMKYIVSVMEALKYE